MTDYTTATHSFRRRAEKYALGLYKSGTRWETITLMGLLAVFGGFAFLQGYLSAVHVLTQLKLLAQFI